MEGKRLVHLNSLIYKSHFFGCIKLHLCANENLLLFIFLNLRWCVDAWFLLVSSFFLIEEKKTIFFDYWSLSIKVFVDFRLFSSFFFLFPQVVSFKFNSYVSNVQTFSKKLPEIHIPSIELHTFLWQTSALKLKYIYLIFTLVGTSDSS